MSIDASAAALGAGFSRAARRRIDNALFVLASAEALPQELLGLACEVRLHFPWGSLLKLVLAGDDAFISDIAELLAPDGRLLIALSVTALDAVPGIECLDEEGARRVLARFESTGRLAGGDVTPITPARAKTLHSSWAARLRVGTARPGWLLQTRRAAPGFQA